MPRRCVRSHHGRGACGRCWPWRPPSYPGSADMCPCSRPAACPGDRGANSQARAVPPVGGQCRTKGGTAVTVLLVDAANVVGSRPDGWWRDREGAAERLLARLAGLVGRRLIGPDGADLTVEEVVAVVEGRARDATAPEGIRVVRARGSRDD